MVTSNSKKFVEIVTELSEQKGKTFLNKEEGRKFYEEINLQMKQARRDYQRKAQQSEIEAATIVLNS